METKIIIDCPDYWRVDEADFESIALIFSDKAPKDGAEIRVLLGVKHAEYLIEAIKAQIDETKANHSEYYSKVKKYY